MFDIFKRFNFWDGVVTGCGIARPDYISALDAMLEPKNIITITGGRRTGKSVVVRQFIRYLINEKKVDPTKIFYANLFIQDIDFMRDSKKFKEILNEWKKKFNHSPGERLFIVIDEVQEIANWEKTVVSLYEDYTADHKIIITGSNAKLLSGELHTYLAGRSFEMTLYPLSFMEYCSFLNKSPDRAACIEYLNTGGMPEVVKVKDVFARQNLVSATVDSIIVRDIATRHQIRNIPLLRKMADYFCFSPTDEVSRTRISNILKEGGENASINTVSEYMEYLKDAFFIHECPLLSHKKGDVLKSVPLKVYLNDTSFAKTADEQSDFGKLLENIIFIELIRRGFKVKTLKTDSGEIDFVARIGNKLHYYQVAYLIGEKGSAVYNREFGNLMKIKDHFPKTVLSMDELLHQPVEGINHESVVEFLKNPSL
ncbi:MAG TPA: ATP-binding protein [bacterium]|mgnify:FL=1|nr:ATP-binding protein [bacterium]